MNQIGTTVAAISTPPGKGGVALIRVSGAEAVNIVSRCVTLRSGKPLSALPARYAAYGDVIFEGAPIDDVLVTVFYAPHSYTGEDTVEICCHGGILLTKTVLSALFAAGAEQAGPGEFTRRALLSGRLSLTEAEAIGCLLEAGSTAQIRLSASAARTQLAKELSALHDGLLSLMSSLYAKIDYPDEDLADLTDEEIITSLLAAESKIQGLQATYRTGRAINEGIPTVLCGSPNVGKSALYNRLAGEDLAIVTDYAGTTRDVLSTSVPLGSVMLRLSDTAGLRETSDPVEQIGVSRSRSRMADGELLLAVFDASRPLSSGDNALLRELAECPQTVVVLLNKADLPRAIDEAAFAAFAHVIPLSAKTGDGIDKLTALIEKLFTDETLRVGEEAIVSSARQYAALTRAGEHLRISLDAFRGGMPADAAASDLELALGALADLDGRAVNEEIIADIFKRFCVGK
ncbi:MAG: tRNA uridine-5-carboxymethylaminomethyl(34) synthesis GTPase MnmE [Clostridia bacterium]|nr:tRNA uridine-5-carboxymethylaminomethyl(34) synthesis GTPase MnmE [Clostridia bacterium]